MFEQLVDERGRVLRSASGPAHVPGLNAGRFGTGTKCVGCHAGHSALPVPESAGLAQWLNVSPSAEITASSTSPSTAGPWAVADRLTQGPPKHVAWVALTASGEHVRLVWNWPIEVKTLVVYALRPEFAPGDLRIHECEIVFFRKGRETGRRTLKQDLSPDGTRVDCFGVRVDAIEIHPLRVTGRVLERPAVAIAEIETIARLAED
jgi:hypothetical protein